jgi:APA family basic amino acid/polyamine antiporter
VIPTCSILFCLILLVSISLKAWLTYLLWIVIGLIVYFAYSLRHADEFNFTEDK